MKEKESILTTLLNGFLIKEQLRRKKVKISAQVLGSYSVEGKAKTNYLSEKLKQRKVVCVIMLLKILGHINVFRLV